MPDEPSPPEAKKRMPIIRPTNRFTISLPFSAINIRQPTEEIVELARIVSEMAALVVDCVSEDRKEDAEALSARAGQMLQYLEAK